MSEGSLRAVLKKVLCNTGPIKGIFDNQPAVDLAHWVACVVFR